MCARDNSGSQVAAAAENHGYDAFAAVYSRWMGEDFAHRVWPIIDRLFASQLAPASTVLDLCCGAGHIAAQLAARPFRVTGVDASEQMLKFARANAPGARFFAGDARDFAFDQPFAGVISTFNSLAHVQTSELEHVFRNVRRALEPGGPFLFDVTMEEAYAQRWSGPFNTVGEGYACIIRPSYDSITRVATNDVTLFERAAGDEWRRCDFTILQNCHPRDAILQALALAGFNHVDSYDAGRDLNLAGETGQAFFLCK
jgi:SAM-dependent methyltransferase